MAGKRYRVKSRKYKTGGPGGSTNTNVWVVWDGLRGKVAEGTSGAGGVPGGYPAKSNAQSLANDLNRKHERALRDAEERRKRERNE